MRKHVDKMVVLAKEGGEHSRRQVPTLPTYLWPPCHCCMVQPWAIIGQKMLQYFSENPCRKPVKNGLAQGSGGLEVIRGVAASRWQLAHWILLFTWICDMCNCVTVSGAHPVQTCSFAFRLPAGVCPCSSMCLITHVW